MLKSPVDRDPARPPWLEPQLLGAHGVAAELKDIEVLPRENVPVALEKGATEMFRQRLERAMIRLVVRVDRIIGKPGANEIVIALVV
jgi:hypothetical protein